MGTTTHPHPCRCRARAFSSPPGLPFVLSCPGIGLSFPGPLSPPCSVVDVPFGVVGGGIGAGGRGTARDVVVVKGSGWCNEGRTMMWQCPYLARSGLGNRRNRRNPVFWAYRAHFCVDFDDPNINLKGLLCIFWMWGVFLRIFMFSLIILCSFCKIDLVFRFFYTKKGSKRNL